jgi:23S rRNA (pseudouridine1915-N3)-methyltransferase
MKIRLFMLGKTRRGELRALIEQYLVRIRPYCPVEQIELSPGRLSRLRPERGSLWVLLDETGREFRSEEFARWLGELRERGTREVDFFLGNASGYPDELREKAGMKISLSRLTFSHELARVVLAEQLYRAFTILADHPYPK